MNPKSCHEWKAKKKKKSQNLSTREPCSAFSMSDVTMKLQEMVGFTLKKRSMHNRSLSPPQQTEKRKCPPRKKLLLRWKDTYSWGSGASDRYLLDSQPLGELTDCPYHRNRGNSLGWCAGSKAVPISNLIIKPKTKPWHETREITEKLLATQNPMPTL